MLKRIILHWSAGRYYPTEFEKQYYHYLVDVDGNVTSGKFRPEDNEDCTDGCYAAHTGGGNTGSIGVCLCGMCGFISNSFCGYYPIVRKQFESCMSFTAVLCKKYGIKISPQTVLTHYEFGKLNPKTSSAGKIDIVHLPPYPWVAKDDVGSFIRTKVRWYLEKL
ncbi:N-acetylmuramoyl-L-alanine amidase [bacterium]|nr:N-acetylmuramoyl-L-alanine amidase [bacterium]